ncbi:MAG: HTH-type transcriptional regulator BenM [Pseudomonadota bacterium]|jgi:DNA-binding transcriptional LysR family regulator
MTLIQLKHFIALAQQGSFVRAARVLHMTQPALSRSIKGLETDLGRLLFDRIGRRIELTPFGQKTLDRAQALIDDAAGLVGSGKGLQAEDTGRIRLGLSSGPGAVLSAALLAHFAQRFPRLHLDIVRANTSTLAHMLRDRQVDALVADVRALQPAPDLTVGEVQELEGGFLVRPGHPLSRRRQVTLKQVRDFPLASTQLSDEMARILVERYGEEAHPQTLVRLTSDEITHLQEMALQTDAVVLAVHAACPDLVPIKVQPALDARARFALVTLSRRSEAPHLEEIRAVIQAVFGQAKPERQKP